MSQNQLVACPHCHRRNRLPSDKPPAVAHCGVCKQLLFTGAPVALSAPHFDAHLNSDVPLLVDFWAPWCGPCRAFAPTFQQAAQQLEPQVRLAKVNTEEEPGLANRFAIRSIPTLILFAGGKERARVSGAMNNQQLRQWLQQNLPVSA